MGQQCFVCQNKIGTLSLKMKISDLTYVNIPIPNGMTNEDRVCTDCYNKDKEKSKEVSKQLKEEFSGENKQLMDDIRKRIPEYKARWDKGGVIQYKDKYCAILRRVWGQQVEFIIAYSDLTKEGYRMMAQDEGKTGSSGGLTGGVDSYYYFQKISFVR